MNNDKRMDMMDELITEKFTSIWVTIHRELRKDFDDHKRQFKGDFECIFSLNELYSVAGYSPQLAEKLTEKEDLWIESRTFKKAKAWVDCLMEDLKDRYNVDYINQSEENDAIKITFKEE